MLRTIARNVPQLGADAFDVAEAVYWIASDYGGSEFCPLRRAANASAFEPGCLAYGPQSEVARLLTSARHRPVASAAQRQTMAPPWLRGRAVVKAKKPKLSAPVCVFCKRSAGVTFAIFSPRFAPFGTACTDCERDLPPGTVPPAPPPEPTT